MTGPLAQIVALTCYGNAVVGGLNAPQFFPTNSTCQFCDSITFVETKKSFLGKPKEVVVAGTPDEWIAGLKNRNATGLRLVRFAQNAPGISDRMSAGFVGGGGTWMMEVLRSTGTSEFWAAGWEVWNQNAPQRRIWRVTYARVDDRQTAPYHGRDLASVTRDLKVSLEAIRSFSTREKCGGFTKCFEDALKALEDPNADVGYHKDIAVPGQLTREANAILKAAMSAWVFGGMGSWNDIGFEGATQDEYEKVSESLFTILNESIERAATSSASGKPEGARSSN